MHWTPQAKELVSVLVSFTLVTGAKKAHEVIMDWVFCINFPMQFWKDKMVTIWALINLSSKLNAISPA